MIVWEILLGQRGPKTSLGQNYLWIEHNLGLELISAATPNLRLRFLIIEIDFSRSWVIISARGGEVKKCLTRAPRQDGI